MPIHFTDIDIISQTKGLSSALIVPCYLCPAVTVAVRENEPFIQLSKGFLTSAPFERYLKKMQLRLKRSALNTKVFRSYFPHQWFLCMWTSRQCKKLKGRAKKYEAIIVLGCSSATETIRSLVNTDECPVIEGMAVAGIMNAKLKFHLPGDISFSDSRVIPMP